MRDIFCSRKLTGHQSRPDSPLRCSFCNKSQDDVRKLIAGPAVYICDECVEVCNNIIVDADQGRHTGLPDSTLKAVSAPDGRAPSYAVPCSLCALPVPLDEALAIPERGFLCEGCTSAVQMAVAQRESN
jgi:hypothetical protein